MRALEPRVFPLSAVEVEAEPDATRAERALGAYFVDKGLASLKEDDARSAFDDRWLAYQAEHRLYFELLRRDRFDPLVLARFMERFGWYAGSQGYSLQVSLLGVLPFWISRNEALRAEAMAALERGEVFAFGLSEKDTGADIYATGTRLAADGEGRWKASGSKHYIGNAHCAGLISVLARFEEPGAPPPWSGGAAPSKEPFVFFALRPKGQHEASFQRVAKIPTMGVRGAYVGSFDVVGAELGREDLLATGEEAWDTVFGTVNVGKLMLGFGAIGLCERALHEAVAHFEQRRLYGRTVASMPHIRALVEEARLRLHGMRLYAYRAVDYAKAPDRRMLLFNAVQKAKVTTEGVRVVALLAEGMGAKGFEATTAFETVQREIVLLPGLEGSTHINYGLVGRLIANVIRAKGAEPPPHAAEGPSERLFSYRASGLDAIAFADLAEPLGRVSGRGAKAIRRQYGAFRRLAVYLAFRRPPPTVGLEVAKLFAHFPYASLIAEAATLDHTDPDALDRILLLVSADLDAAALRVASSGGLDVVARSLARSVVAGAVQPPASA